MAISLPHGQSRGNGVAALRLQLQFRSNWGRQGQRTGNVSELECVPVFPYLASHPAGTELCQVKRASGFLVAALAPLAQPANLGFQFLYSGVRTNSGSALRFD